jgi:hypothetical protein
MREYASMPKANAFAPIRMRNSAWRPPHRVAWYPLHAVAIATSARTVTSRISIRSNVRPSSAAWSDIRDYPGKTLMALAITRIAASSDTNDSSIIAIFAQVLTGRLSVGLNAVAFVNDR